MIDINIVMISFLLAFSITFGLFSITQLGYKQRGGGIEMFLKSILWFIIGFFTWPILFPIGIMEGKYKMNVHHKVGRRGLDL